MEALEGILIEWVNYHAQNGIMQRSTEWYERRKKSIGGSAFATLIGKNPYNNLQSLILDKAGHGTFAGSLSTRWGVLFEDIAQMYVEMAHSCKVHGANMFIDGILPNLSYSPDGLAVMNLRDYDEIVLLEFKCPHLRIPDGKVPNYYLPQVRMGMDMLTIPTAGLFVEVLIRRCTWDQLGADGHIIHYKDEAASIGQQSLARTFTHKGGENKGNICTITDAISCAPIVSGIVGIYSKVVPPKYLDEFELGAVDLATASESLFATIMEMLDGDDLKIYYGALHQTGDLLCDQLDADLLTFINDVPDGYFVIGILPYKVLRVVENIVPKVDNYIAPWLIRAREIMELAVECKDKSRDEVASCADTYCGVVPVKSNGHHLNDMAAIGRMKQAAAQANHQPHLSAMAAISKMKLSNSVPRVEEISTTRTMEFEIITSTYTIDLAIEVCEKK